MIRDVFCLHCEDLAGGCWFCSKKQGSPEDSVGLYPKPLRFDERIAEPLRKLVGDVNRPVDWPRDATDIEKKFAEWMAKSFEKHREVASDQLRRLDEDIALLLLTGISFNRITIATYQDEPLKRSIMVDGKSVRDYKITLAGGEKP